MTQLKALQILTLELSLLALSRSRVKNGACDFMAHETRELSANVLHYTSIYGTPK